ncbi:MAG: type II toxin-antitoxin system Phd/YefM family antitoxin [Magnetococcales bacterium]|nr:type II toxin-antitoxin system Phd/YefM family antitoxin [Magnetococcales bacterium]
MDTWQLQTAKARFSEVVKQAASHGPQVITVRGKAEAVLLSKEAFDKMVKPKPLLTDFIRNSPLADVELDLTRDKSSSRADIEL